MLPSASGCSTDSSTTGAPVSSSTRTESSGSGAGPGRSIVTPAASRVAWTPARVRSASSRAAAGHAGRRDLRSGRPDVAGKPAGRLPRHAVAPLVHAIVHDDVRLQPAHEVVELQPLLVGPVVFPLAVEPQHADPTVAREQL